MSELHETGSDEWYGDTNSKPTYIPLTHLGDGEYRLLQVAEWNDRITMFIVDDYEDRYTNDNQFKNGVWTPTKLQKYYTQGSKYFCFDDRKNKFIEDLIDEHSETLAKFNIPHPDKLNLVNISSLTDQDGGAYRVLETAKVIVRADEYTGEKDIDSEEKGYYVIGTDEQFEERLE